MEAVQITQREIEIRFDDSDKKLIKEGWRLEQLFENDGNQDILVVRIASKQEEVPG